MWLSVAFPTCPSCTKNANKCYHKNCPKGAKHPMEINPDTSFVRCPSCNKEWYIMDSNYYCSCGHAFTANDVSIEVNAIVANARLIAQEMRRNAATRSRINNLTNNDIETRTESTIRKTFGDKVWNIIKGSLPAIVETIKIWLGIK